MSNIIIPDKYNIAEYIEELKAKHITDMKENALLMSTFGFLGDFFTKELSTDLMVMSEISNEALPLTAKYDRDILTHAIQYSVSDLYASPAYMDVQLGISEQMMNLNIKNNSNTFVIDKDTPFFIESYEFHLDYDIIISRSKPYNYSSDGYVYIAQYDISESNSISNIESPYIAPPTRMNINGTEFIMVSARIRQVEPSTITRKITSDDTIENKTFEFSFESQLATFDILVTDPNGNSTILTPIFEGVPITDTSKDYVYYTHIDNNTIRVKFISSYYNPSLNSIISVRIKTTQGKDANFTYKSPFLVTPQSEKYNYNGMALYVIPYTDSDYGSNMKSIDDLKREIPMRVLARDSITSDKDIENYFNILNDENNRTVISKQIHNQNTLRFYLYLLMKDSENNVIPTNTLPLKISDSFMKNNNDVIKPGTLFHYTSKLDHAEISSETITDDISDSFTDFYYSLPFLIKVTREPLLHLSYYLNIINITYQTNFSYINRNAFLQFICTAINIKREFLTDRNNYKITASLTQNINEEFEIITLDQDGNVADTENFKPFLVFYDQFGNPVKYKMCNITSYNPSLKEYTIEAILDTEDEFDVTGKLINITNLNDFGHETESDTYLPRQTKVVLYTAYKLQGVESNDRDDADRYVPGLDGFILSNKYTIDPGLDLYLNFSEIINSSISLTRNNSITFNISSVPLIQYTYMQNEEHVVDIIDSFVTRKLYIDEAMNILQDPLGIDLKLFNTYGPSKTYFVGHDKIELNRVNIILKLRMKLDITASDNLKDVIMTDVKSYMEDINDIKDFHYSSLDQYLRNKYPAIKWIEFLEINDYGSDNQYIRKDETVENCVPEFLNINTNNGIPDIQISIV